jgi:hypothetical protein
MCGVAGVLGQAGTEALLFVAECLTQHVLGHGGAAAGAGARRASLRLVTDVDVDTGRSLIDSMSNEVVVRGDSIRTLIPFEPTSYYGAVPTALGERAITGRG